jgi:type IV secretory pathway TraG/TraD family ATPase VirD4
VALGVVMMLAAIAWVLWATTGLASVLSGHPSAVGLSSLAQLEAGLPSHLSDPAAAYDASLEHHMPGASLWWFAFAVVVIVTAAVAVFVAQLWLGSRASPSDARWANWWDLRPLRTWRREPGRLVLGRVGRRLVATEACHSVMVFGPTGSMKTTGLVIPSILEWDGPVLSTTIKSDVIEATYKARRHGGGRTWVFDPTEQLTEYQRSGWSPLDGCTEWERAKPTGQALASAAQTASGTDLRDDSFWFGGAGRLLSLYLFAAAISGCTIDQVVRWVSVQERAEVEAILDRARDRFAIDAWAAAWNDRRELRQDFFSTAVAALDSFSSPQVRETLRRSEIDFDRFLDGEPNTIYITAPMMDQHMLRPLFSAFMTQAIDAVYAKASSHPLSKPVLVVIDEAANIAPLEDLPSIAATARSHGIQLVTVWQDLAQVEERYRSSSRTLFNNHLAKVALSGSSDLTTLGYLSQLLGESVVSERSTHRDAVGVTSSTEAPRHRALAPIDSIRQMRRGHGLLVYGHLRPARLQLRLSWADRRLRRLAGPQPKRSESKGEQDHGRTQGDVGERTAGDQRAAPPASDRGPARGGDGVQSRRFMEPARGASGGTMGRERRHGLSRGQRLD